MSRDSGVQWQTLIGLDTQVALGSSNATGGRVLVPRQTAHTPANRQRFANGWRLAVLYVNTEWAELFMTQNEVLLFSTNHRWNSPRCSKDIVLYYFIYVLWTLSVWNKTWLTDCLKLTCHRSNKNKQICHCTDWYSQDTASVYVKPHFMQSLWLTGCMMHFSARHKSRQLPPNPCKCLSDLIVYCTAMKVDWFAD